MRLLTLCLTLTTAASPAFADDLRRKLGDGYELQIDNRSLYVVKGNQRARLVGGHAFERVSYDKAKKQVTVEIADDSCDAATTHTWSTAHLDARLDNWAGYSLYQQKKYADAIPAYRRAAAADPSWKIPAVNLASAYNLTGDPTSAIGALAPWLASDPVGTYATITLDPELRSLRTHSKLAAIRATKPGTAKIDGATATLIPSVALSADRKYVAVVHDEASWGASLWMAELELHELATGRIVGTLPLVTFADTNPDCYDDKCKRILKPAAVHQRVAVAQQLLVDLGFTSAAVEDSTSVTRTDDNKFKASFTKAKLGVVARDGTARVVQGNTVLATASISDRLHAAAYLTELRTVILWSGRPGREGCEGSDPTAVTVVRLP